VRVPAQLGTAAAALLVLVSPAIAQDSGIARLEVLGRALRSAPVWRADYRQEYLPAGMDMGEVVNGVVWAAWPDHALFRTTAPAQQRMGLEGRTVRLLDLEVPSCDQHSLSDEEWARVPLAAVLDPRGAVEHFTVLELGDRGITLVPREPGGVDRVQVVLGDNDLPAEVVIVDPQGATNRLTFRNWQKSDAPPDGRWLPQPPADLECIADDAPTLE
jgi:outer membrane lipoprotein-sorting protein